MKISVKGLGIAISILWAGAILIAGLANRFFPGYALAFLNLVDSVYPGYHAAFGLKNLIAGVGYGLLDGFICGACIAWIHNRVVSCHEAKK